MTISEIVAVVCAIFTGVGLLILVVEKLWGGGNALAGKFYKLERDTTAAMTSLETRIRERVDQYEDNYTVSADAIRANIHALQMGLLEFRAKMAEEYVRQGGLDDIKQDMRRGFEAVDKRMSELQDMIVAWAQPEGRPR